MTREEAINKVRQMSLPKETIEILQALAPELAESEDERIRKELVEKITNLACGCFISQEQKQKFIAYLEKQKEQKPVSISCGHENDAEWSGEDDEMYINVASSLRGYSYGLENEEHKRHIQKGLDWLENRFKSLRPSWKPSEEQMEALEAATVRYQSTGLESLYEDLKKL